ESLGRLEVDDQLKLCGLFYGKISRPGAFEDLVDVDGGAAEQICIVRPIGYEASGIHKLSKSVNGREVAHRCEVHDPSPGHQCLTTFHRHESVDPVQKCCFERSLEFLGSLCLDAVEVDPDGLGDLLDFPHHQQGVGVARIQEHADSGYAGYHLLEEPQPLAAQLRGGHTIEPPDIPARPSQAGDEAVEHGGVT